MCLHPLLPPLKGKQDLMEHKEIREQLNVNNLILQYTANLHLWELKDLP